MKELNATDVNSRMGELVQKHNQILRQIEDLKDELKSLSSETLKEIDNLNRNEAIRLYNTMEDSQIKYQVFLKLTDNR